MISWGFDRRKVRRFKCKSCNKLFSNSKNKASKNLKFSKLFVKWISSGVSVEQLIALSKADVSTKQLTRYFHDFLDKTPMAGKLNIPNHINLKVDATYFGQSGCSIVFKERTNIIYWSYVNRESYQNYVLAFSKLLNLGYLIDSVTSDKHQSLIAVVRKFLPNTPHQLCLVHIQRRCQTLLTQNPSSQAGIDLLQLVKFLNQINNTYEKQIFLKWLVRYELKYKHFLNHRTYSNNLTPNNNKHWWYTHKNVRKAFIHLKSSTPNMFFYLDNPNIPKDNNGLEAEFTHLKTKVKLHRGLREDRRINFVNWYWFLKSKKLKLPTQNVH